jgi:hypothetical protein
LPGLFSSPSDNAAQAAAATSTADNAEIANEENYVTTSEGQLRGAIAGLGPNPYFTPPTPPAPVNPGNTTTFSTPGPKGTTTAGASSNLFAAPPSSNLFAAPAPRQAQPIARAPATAAQ